MMIVFSDYWYCYCAFSGFGFSIRCAANIDSEMPFVKGVTDFFITPFQGFSYEL